MTYHSYKSFLFSLALIGLSAMVSCNKEQDTIAIITVTNGGGLVVSGASVNIQGGTRINVTETTGSNGQATFLLNEYYEQGQFGLAVLDITVTKGPDTGTGVIQILEESTTEATVEIGP